jgi:glutathione peroxidase-family protein
MKHILNRRTILTVIASAIVCGLLSFAPAGSSYKIGDSVADFTIKNPMTGKPVSLYSLPGATKGAIVVFTCNHCPFAKKYEQRIIDLDKKYASKGFPVLAICPNDPSKAPEDAPNLLASRAKEKGYTFPYAFDGTQEVAKAFGAAKTPHAFLVSKEGGKWVLKYMGAIDDNTDEPQNVKNPYLSNAIDAVLSGKPVAVTETKSIGCTIKWKNS